MSTARTFAQHNVDRSDSALTALAQSFNNWLVLIQGRRLSGTLLHQNFGTIAIAVRSVIAGGNG